MKIQRRRIRNVEHYLSSVPDGADYRVIYAVEDDEMLTRLGLSKDAGSGETVLPRIVGPITRFNAEGRWNYLRDRPREVRYVRTVEWKWTDWQGDEYEDYKDIYRLCYQRELIPPPSVELTYIEREGGIIVSPPMKRNAREIDSSRHLINLMLEIFGSCEVATADLQRVTPPAIRKANWKLLPAGEYPWDKIQQHIARAVQDMGNGIRNVIVDRQKTIEDLKPDERWVGEGGFNDYMAYIFKKADIIILESLRRDNAIYAFKHEWRRVSQLTKAEIIRGGLYHARIVHTKGWKGKLAQLLDRN